MASENEASCESDPNFAVICGFLEKFGATCGLNNIDFVDLQEMLENTVEVSPELVELHVKLMRKARRSVSSNNKWERALIKTCHTFSSQDAWEIERFGYKKARISSKLRVLKELLEMQFDYNQKFKNEINKITAGELRAQPLGRDRMGRSYWYQCDENCQIRVYKDDPDDETWTLVAKDRDGLVSLISQLTNGDTAKSSSEPVSNEDSNSVEVEKPTLDTGQDTKNAKEDSESENIEIEAKGLENTRNIAEENASEDANLPDAELEKRKSSKNTRNIAEENAPEDANLPDASLEKPKGLNNTGNIAEEDVPENANLPDAELEKGKSLKNTRNIAEENASEDANLPDAELEKSGIDEDSDEIPEEPTNTTENEIPSVSADESANIEAKTPSEQVEEINKEAESQETSKEDEVIKQIPEEDGENALNLCSKDLTSISEEHKDEKSCLDLSVKTAPCLRIKPLTELMAQPQKKDFAGIKGKYIRGEHPEKNSMYPNPTHCGKAVQSASYDAICYKRSMQEDIYSAPTNLKHPRFDRPTLLGNKNYISYLNDQDDEEEEVDDEELEDEEIEEPLMLVQGEGSGFPNQSTNQSEDSCPIVGEEIEEAVMIVRGEGDGKDCQTGNKIETDSQGNDSTQTKDHSDRAKDKESLKPDPHEKLQKDSAADLNNSAENVLDNNKNDDTSSNPESFNSPVKQNFFFGNSFSPSTSPLKTASLSFGASTVAVDSCSKSDENHLGVEDVKPSSEKTDETVGRCDPPQITKVPENVDIETVDNNKSEARETREDGDCFSDEASSEHEQNCDVTVNDESDCVSAKCGTTEEITDDAGGVVEDTAVSLVTRTNEENGSEIASNNLETSSEQKKVSKTDLSEDTHSDHLRNQLKADVSESETVLNDPTSEEILKNEDYPESKPNIGIEIPSTHKESSNDECEILSDTRTEEATPESDCVDKDEFSTEIISTEEDLAAPKLAQTAEDVPSSTTDDIKNCINEKVEDQVDGDIKSADDTEKPNDIVLEEIKEKDIVEAVSSNKVIEENQKKEDASSKPSEESQADETADSNHIMNEAPNKTTTPVKDDQCSEEKNNDVVTDVKDEEVIEDLCKRNEINQIEEKIEILPALNKEEETNKIDRPAKEIEIEDEDSIGDSIPDMGHSDNDDFDNEEPTEEKDGDGDETDCITNSTNEIPREKGEDIPKITEDDAIKENEEISSKTTGDNVEISENDKIISSEREDSSVAEIEENKSAIKDQDENLDRAGNVETAVITDDKPVESEAVKVSRIDAETVSVEADEKIEGETKENGDKVNSNDLIELTDEKESKSIEDEKPTLEKNVPNSGDAPPPNDNPTNSEITAPIIIINDDDANDTGIEAIKAIKITKVQAKCEMPEQIEAKVDQNQDKIRNEIDPPIKVEAPKPQPLRFLRGRRPNQMLSVKSYATRNKNLVLRKEIKPPPVQIEEKKGNNADATMNNTDDPLLKIIKSEDAVTEMPTRRSTRRRPGEPLEKPPVVPRIPPVEITKRGRGRQRKIIQPEVDPKRLRLSNNRISEAADLETIDLTSESDGRKISVKNCDETIVLKGGITINPVFKNDNKKSNGPFLSCVNIQKLKETPPEHADSPLSVASSGGGDNSDVVIIEDDPLAVPEPFNSVSAAKPAMTLNSLQFDVDPPSPPSTIITRSLRKRGITEPEIVVPSGGKRRKTKGKRQVDLELRRSIEEQKKQEVSSSSEEDKEEIAAKRKLQPLKKKPEPPAVAPVKKPRAQRKKTLLGLDVPEALEELNTTISSVRQSRRIAQLKIKEEAERRKLEESTTVDNKEQKRKGKKNIDKDYKAEKRKRPKPPTEEEVTVDVPEIEEKKTKRKRRRKDRDPRKIFDESNPWRSSSDSSSSNDDVEEEEEEIVEYSDAESPLFKSDHEFSPESDIEDAEGAALPLKRARTARKGDEDIQDDTDDHACQKCGKTDHPEWILLCDGCDNGWHCSCLRPALFIIPEGDWFCPPCQHNSLVKQLEEKLVEYDKKMVKREIEVRRKERLAYVGISLANVLPVKDGEEKRKKKDDNSEDDEDDSASVQSDSSSESSSSSDSDEPIYQLRQRRQAHSYRFNDYDDLINSAIQDEMDAVKGAGNQGRGKDISTIVNAEKEEMENEKEKEPEELPPVVPQESKELPPAVVPPAHEHESEEEKIVKPVKKFIGRKKQRKLNSLDVSSGDDPDSDEDFKGSSSDEEDEDDFEEDLGSDSSEAYGRRRKGMPVRRSTRARTSRYDKDFINDDSDDEDLPRKKKSRSIWDESESEESDRSWGRSSRRKAKRFSGSKKKRSKKSKKNFDDSDEDRSKKKKRRIKYGGLDDDDDEEEEVGGRRTRGKKINYADVLASDSDEEIKKKAPPRIESDDDYVANDEEQEEQDDEDFEKEESAEDDKGDKDESQKKDDEKETAKTPAIIPDEPKQSDPTPVPPPNLPEDEKSEINPTTEQDNFDLDNLNSSIDDLPDDLDNDDDDGLNPIEEINKNLEEMDEEEMEKLMEEEEYANKQLQLMAMQLEKEKKRREREAKKKEMALATTTAPVEKSPKKRGRKIKQADTSPSSNVVQIGALQVGPDMQSNLELSEPPGITIPIFSEIPPPTDGSPKKRRGRGKGKKTLEKEAAAAAAASGSAPSTPTPATPMPTTVASDSETTHIPTTVDTVANISEDLSLANAAVLHGAKLAVAAPPQPFSQTQPAPSVITRMLQAQPGQGGFSSLSMGHNNYYADQPPQENPAQVVANAQIPVGNSLGPAGNHNQQLPPISQPQQQYMHGSPQARGLSSTVYRQPPPNVNPYHRSSPAPPVRVRTPAPSIPNVYHSHHPLDPSPSGGGPINVPPPTISTPDSPVSIPPASDSPLSNKSDPTPPPPPYNRPQMRFTNVNTTPPMSSSPIRQQQQPQQPSQQSQNLLAPQQQHLPQQQQQSSPLRNSMPPYNPAGIPPNYYGGYLPGNIGTEDALPPTGYHYSDQFSETDSPQDLGKGYDEENSGEFGGLVSYFSSQREDDLDT